MIPNAYSDIAAKDAERKSLSAAVEGYLAGGGRVTDLCPIEAEPKTPPKPSPVQDRPISATKPSERRGQLSVLEELRDIQARAAELHLHLDRIEQELLDRADGASGEQTP